MLASLTIASVLALAGCVTPSVEPAVNGNPDFLQHQQAVLARHEWQLDGRLAIRQGNSSSTVTIDWLQRASDFDIRLRGSLIPLGSTHVFGSDAGLTIERAGQDTVSLPNLRALTRDYLNFDFPAANLTYWVRGLPAPGLPENSQFDASNLLVHLTQTDEDGRTWELHYDRYTAVDSLPLPGRVRVNTADLQLTFLISGWQLPSP